MKISISLHRQNFEALGGIDAGFAALKEAGIEKPGNIVNPVGGCDSTPFHKAGVRTVTFAAQDPVMTNYYHTFYDTPDRFSVETVGTGLDVILRVIDKIAAVEDSKRAESTPALATEARAEATEASAE